MVNGYPMTVIGIAPRIYRHGSARDSFALWMPATMAEQAGNLDSCWNRLLDRRAAWLHVFGRLRPGVTIEAAKASLQPWFRATLEARSRTPGFPKVTEEQRREFLSSTLDLESAAGGYPYPMDAAASAARDHGGHIAVAAARVAGRRRLAAGPRRRRARVNSPRAWRSAPAADASRGSCS
jgi:hypothetical protein